MPGNITTCRSCGARIRWIRTPAGKSMPCDERPISYLPNSQGKAKLVAADGGLWKSQAMDNVKAYLTWALAEIPDRGRLSILA